MVAPRAPQRLGVDRGLGLDPHRAGSQGAGSQGAGPHSDRLDSQPSTGAT